MSLNPTLDQLEQAVAICRKITTLETQLKDMFHGERARVLTTARRSPKARRAAKWSAAMRREHSELRAAKWTAAMRREHSERMKAAWARRR